MEDYKSMLPAMFARTRRQAIISVLAVAAFTFIDLVVVRQHSWILYGFNILLVVISLSELRRWVLLRPGSVSERMLMSPASLTRVRVMPLPSTSKYPARRIPPYVEFTGPSSTVRLKLGAVDVPAFVAAFHAAAPGVPVEAPSSTGK